MTLRAARRRLRSDRPQPRRRAPAGVGVALPVAVVVALTGASAVPAAVTGGGGTDLPTASWRVDLAAAHRGETALGEQIDNVIVRETSARAARGAERARAATLAAESTRRAATEAALAATEHTQDIAKVPPPAPTWQRPLDGGYTLTSGFGLRWGAVHPAQDFATPEGTPVRSPTTGTVLFAGWQGGYGNKVEIQLWDGTVVWFAHNSALGVTQGQAVATGQVVAASGNTGHSTGPHVHVEVHPAGGDPVPVMEWLAAHNIAM